MHIRKILRIFNRYITEVDFNEITGRDSYFFVEVDELFMDLANNLQNNKIDDEFSDENIIELAQKINDILIQRGIKIE